MIKSYWDMYDEHEDEISKIPYHDNVLVYLHEAPSTVGTLHSDGFFMLRCIMLCFFCIISWRNSLFRFDWRL